MFFKLLKSQNILVKSSKNAFFQGTIQLRFVLENFLSKIWICWSHAEVSPNVVLSVEEKLMVIGSVDRKISLQKIKNCNFLVLEGQILRLRISKKWLFSVIFWLQTHLENFLQVLCYHPRYLKCSPNVALSNGKKIMVIRFTGEKIFGKNQNGNSKKQPSPPSTVQRLS